MSANTVTSKFIDSVWTSADDQISSQYRLSVSIPSSSVTKTNSFASTATNSWIFRMDKNFTVPQQQGFTYETYFNGLKIPRVGAKEETDKKIKLDVRADQAGEIYTYFKDWVDQGFNPTDAYMGSEATLRKDHNVKVELLKRGSAKTSSFASSEVAKSFTFSHCQPFNVMITELDHSNGEPIRVEVEFIYLYYVLS
jgi:hypothetical protein